jgi:hypothetical protein
MKVGDMVKMKVGYSSPGIIIEIVDIPEEKEGFRHYAKVLWSDYGMGLEKRRDLEVVSSLIECESDE